MKYLTLFFILIFSLPAMAKFEFFAEGSSYETCFTPQENCTQILIDTIVQAKKEILIQAYSFTSPPIAKALVFAKKQGVDVKAILDKSQFTEKHSVANFFAKNNIPLWNDNTVAIAHNKVMIIDGYITVTGSFNFTKSAQKRNSENLIIIRDHALAQSYKENWMNRFKRSVAFQK